jgi:hypothetical protein
MSAEETSLLKSNYERARAQTMQLEKLFGDLKVCMI